MSEELRMPLKVGSHPDLFGGESDIVKDVPAREATYMSVEVSWYEIERTEVKRTYYVKTERSADAEDLALTKAKAEADEVSSWADEYTEPEVQSVDAETGHIDGRTKVILPNGKVIKYADDCHFIPDTD